MPEVKRNIGQMSVGVFLLLLSITSHAQRLVLSTKSDSAKFYYYKGWQQVLDEGNYSASEEAYRKMIAFDPHFLVGLTLVGRISTDLKERERIESSVNERKEEVSGDERLLLEVFMELLKLTNLREKNSPLAKEQRIKAMATGERNLGIISRRYPGETYYRSEYVEVLNHNHGAAAALDSLKKWNDLKDNLFLTGYKAQLLAELRQFEEALSESARLRSLLGGRQSPRAYVTEGTILLQKGDVEAATLQINSALKLDPKNLDAQRLKAKLVKK